MVIIVLKAVIFKRSSLISVTVTVLVHTATSAEHKDEDKYLSQFVFYFQRCGMLNVPSASSSLLQICSL